MSELQREVGGEWRPAAACLASLQAKGVAWRYREEDAASYILPDVLAGEEGGRIDTPAAWEARRLHILKLFERNVYGVAPVCDRTTFSVTEGEIAPGGGPANARRVEITCHAGADAYRFEATVLIPPSARKPVPAFLFINNREPEAADPSRRVRKDFWSAEAILARGYAAAVVRTDDIEPDRAGALQEGQGVRAALADAMTQTLPAERWGALAAWAWGASRVMDYLQTDAAIDAGRVAIVGHSRGGKAALWAAATDARFAIAISNESGRGGAGISRRRMGETVKVINDRFPYWFCENFWRFNDCEDALPIDQHQLLALIAPRAVYVASAGDDLWADPRGEFLALAHASAAYALHGHSRIDPSEMPPLDRPLVRGPMGYHIRPGEHDVKRGDWNRFMDFADVQWRAHHG